VKRLQKVPIIARSLRFQIKPNPLVLIYAIDADPYKGYPLNSSSPQPPEDDMVPAEGIMKMKFNFICQNGKAARLQGCRANLRDAAKAN
jgi:hypothetical protein